MSTDPDPSSTSNPSSDTADRILREILERRRTRADSSSASGELIRAIENYHQRNRLLRASNADPSLHLRMPSEFERDRHRQATPDGFVLTSSSPLYSPPPHDVGSRSPVMDTISPASPIYRQLPATSTSTPFSERRPRMTWMGPSERFMDRPRRRGSSSVVASFQRADRELEVASSNLRALLDDPVPILSTPGLLDHDTPTEDESSRRSKRRKLDNDKLSGGFDGFSYGRYGQIEPGQLKMEIVSCDGGIYSDDNCGQFGAENVLRNDKTVYCTKGNRCNLILKHQGSTPFCLSELIIKAPPLGYTAPVQEGMAFISMTSDDLLTRTALYQIQYSPPRPGPPSQRARERTGENGQRIISIRHNNRDHHTSSVQARMRRLYDLGREALDEDENDYQTAQIPSDFDVPKAPPFQVTIEYTDGDEEDVEPVPTITNRRRLAPIRHGFQGFEQSDDEDSSDERAFAEDFAQYRRAQGYGRQTASQITLAEAVEASQVATQEAVKAVGGELMAPHARFFIEQDKSKCTIKFDPPVSGRFILLKMWSPHATPSANIDIQSIVARGFAGPRFFPAIKMR